MSMDALRTMAAKHSRLIHKIDGVTFVDEPDLVGNIGWSVTLTISTNDNGWDALRLLKNSGADIVISDPIAFSEFQLTVGVLWQCSEEFNLALMEVLEVERWLAKVGRQHKNAAE